MHGPRPAFVVASDFRFWSAVLEREITVPAGATTDGPSIPVMLAPLVGGGMLGLRAAVIHDWLCRSNQVLRTEADRGIITLLDRRVVTQRYGKSILNALPPFRREISD